MTKPEWDQFWASEQSSRQSGCLSDRTPAIEAAQRAVWQELARALPKNARVLDLATGNGIVMGWLVATRRDLKPVGIDLAKHIPAPPNGCRSSGGVSMESLPFPDASQDAVTSQFGIEYGDIPSILAEVARVLKPHGRVALVTHRVDGPLLAHNQRRRQGLLWALEEAKLIEKARASLSLRAMGLGVPPALLSAPAEGARLFGTGSAAWEFAEAVSQTLSLGRRDNDQAVNATLATLEAKARSEIARVESLAAACRAIADSEAFHAVADAAGFAVEPPRPLQEPGSTAAFANFWLLRKARPAR
jgi:hypothetical protein